MTLLEFVVNRKIKELQEYLNNNEEIEINKTLFTEAILNRTPVNKDLINKEGGKIVYPILHHCIQHYSVRSKEGKILSFHDIMNILDKAVYQFVTFEYLNGLINLQDQSGNTLLHQAVISNNTEAIEALLKYGANPLIENKNKQIPLDLAKKEKTREALIKSMKDQAQLKKGSAMCDSLVGIIPGVFLGAELGVSSGLIPSMATILCALAVSALVAGIAIGVAIYFLSQDYKQAKSIEKAVNSQLSSIEHEKTADNGAIPGIE